MVFGLNARSFHSRVFSLPQGKSFECYANNSIFETPRGKHFHFHLCASSPVIINWFVSVPRAPAKFILGGREAGRAAYWGQCWTKSRHLTCVSLPHGSCFLGPLSLSSELIPPDEVEREASVLEANKSWSRHCAKVGLCQQAREAGWLWLPLYSGLLRTPAGGNSADSPRIRFWEGQSQDKGSKSGSSIQSGHLYQEICVCCYISWVKFHLVFTKSLGSQNLHQPSAHLPVSTTHLPQRILRAFCHHLPPPITGQMTAKGPRPNVLPQMHLKTKQ